VTVVGNDLTGRTSPVAIARDTASAQTTAAGGSSLLNLGAGTLETAVGARVRVGLADLDLPAGGSGSAAFALAGAADGAPGDLYRLHLVARDGVTGERGVAEGLLLVSRSGPAADAALVALDDRLGRGFGAGGRYRVTASVDAAGESLTVVVGNAAGTPARVRVELP
jgi:hypothetical protein